MNISLQTPLKVFKGDIQKMIFKYGNVYGL